MPVQQQITREALMAINDAKQMTAKLYHARSANGNQ
jgi:hypothetical protein